MSKKHLKPIETDGHFKYRCPSSSCGYCHWVTFKEAYTKNFKVVCDCGTVFKVKQIQKIKILYIEDSDSKPVVTKDAEPTPPSKEETNKIPEDMLVKCSKSLTGYGFTEEESKQLLESAYKDNPTKDIGELLKSALKKVGELNIV